MCGVKRSNSGSYSVDNLRCSSRARCYYRSVTQLDSVSSSISDNLDNPIHHSCCLDSDGALQRVEWVSKSEFTYIGGVSMELTVTYTCINPECYREEQIDVIKIRRGQRKVLKCGFCGEDLVEIQANRKVSK